MKTSKERLVGLILTVLVTMLVVVGIVFADDPARTQAQRQRFNWIVTKRLNVSNLAIFSGDVEVAGDVDFEGDMTVGGDLTVEGDSDLYGDITSSEAAITMTDLVHITGARDATTGYDYFLTIEGDITGQASGAKTYGQYIEIERPAGYGLVSGNVDDAGLKIRVATQVTTYTSGYVMNGADIQAKTDNDAQQPVLRGAQITADTDTDSKTNEAYGLRVYVEGEGVITTTMQVADFELSRQQATDPTYEYGLNIRNTSRAGGGADVALRIESSYGAGGSAADDNWDYIIDMSPADAAVADLRLSQGETIDNSQVDGRIDVTGDITTSGNITVVGTSDFMGNLRDYWGTLTVADDVLIDGQADAVQLTVQANATQSGNVFEVENAASNNLVTVDSSGNTVISGTLTVTGTSTLRGDISDDAGDVTVADDFVVEGTSDLQGAVADSAGTLMILDNVGITGTAHIGGDFVVTGTTDLRGNISSGSGAITMTDSVLVDGQADAVQLTVQGHTTQSGAVFTVENHEANDAFTVGEDGAVFISDTLDVRGNVSDGAGSLVLADNVEVTGTLDVQGGDITLENDETVSNSYNGVITFTATTVDVDAGLNVTGALDVQGGNVTLQNDEAIANSYNGIITMTATSVDVDGNLNVTGALDVQGGDVTLQYDETIANSYDGIITMTATSVDVDGNLNATGALDVQGGNITLQNDETIDNSYNGVITFTMTTMDVVGNLSVTGTTDLQGNVSSSQGVITVTDNILVDGQADVVQLSVQGYSAQASNILQIENAASNNLLTVDRSGNTTISGTLQVTGTSDLRGNVSDSAGTFTVADDMLIDGQADAVQLTIDSYSGQSSNLCRMEDSGNAVFTVNRAGNTVISGTLVVTGTSTLRGNLSDDAGDLTVADSLSVSEALSVTGSSDLLGAVSDTGGTFDLNDDVDVSGAVQMESTLVVSSTSDLQGDVSDSVGIFTIADDLEVTGLGKIDGALTVTGTATFNGDVAIDDTLNIDDTSYVLDGTQTLTPTASLYIFEPASAHLLLTLATGAAAEGDFLYLVNIDATYLVTVTDTGATAGGGNRELGQDDVIGFIYAGAAWVEAFFSDNS